MFRTFLYSISERCMCHLVRVVLTGEGTSFIKIRNLIYRDAFKIFIIVFKKENRAFILVIKP